MPSFPTNQYTEQGSFYFTGDISPLRYIQLSDIYIHSLSVDVQYTLKFRKLI